MKNCCISCPAALNNLVRIGLFLIFFFPGLSKIQMGLGGDTSMMTEMIGSLGLGDSISLILFWVVALAEFFGAIFILLGKLVPKWLYQLSLFLLAIISLVILIRFSDAMMWGRNLLMLLSLIGLMMTTPKCVMGITGAKECGSGDGICTKK